MLQLAYDRDRLPAQRSQNRLEQDALLAVVEALPEGVRPLVLADRGFHRAGFLTWLEYRNLDYVVPLSKGTCLTEPDGRRWKLGEEGLKPGQLRWAGGVRYGLYHGRPRELFVNVALCWRLPKGRARDPRRKRPEEPWYLATSLQDPRSAANWYRQRGWIGQSFKDAKSRFGTGADPLPGAPEPPADGADHRAVVADADGVAGDRRPAPPLACGGRPARAGQHNQPRAGAARSPGEPAALLLTEVISIVVGMRQTTTPS